MSTGMYVHGLNLNDPEWDRIVWGQPPHTMGRVPRAVHFLMTRGQDVELMLFGSGASHRDGIAEGLYTLKYLLRRWWDLREFDVFKRHSRFYLWLLRRRLERIAKPETESRNTFTELKEALPIFDEAGVSRIVVVSELTHVVRCLAHLGENAEARGWLNRFEFSAEASVSFPKRVKASQVVVFEPPADGSGEPGATFKRFFSVPAAERAAKLEEICKILP